MTVEPMPPPKPTIAEIVMDLAKLGMTEEYMSATIVPVVREHYPHMTPEQIDTAIRAEYRAWDAQLGGEEFWADFDAAMALDPDWYETENRSFGPRPGALYDTPQKLVAAYRTWTDAILPPDDLVDALTARAFDALGIKRHKFDPDRPGAIERVRRTMMQLIEEHPRGGELLDYAAEQGRRQLDARRGKPGRD
jgi:hypothetical protein